MRKPGSRILTLSVIFYWCLPTTGFSEEISAFANTSPAMNATRIFKQQLQWQKKYPIPYESKACARGQALSWFRQKPALYKQKFKRLTKFTSVEVVKFPNRESLILLNLGCESYTVFFRFEFRFQESDQESIKGSYIRVVQALNKIRRYSQVDVFKLDKAVNHISTLIYSNDLPNYGEWIRIKGDGLKALQAQFSILKTGFISNKKTGSPRFSFIEFGLIRGPL